MGNRITNVLKRFFDYPIKRKPICFFRQEDFSSTGEPLPMEEADLSGPPTEYDELVQSFYSNLEKLRHKNRDIQEKNSKFRMEQIANTYPGWNEMTLSHLHSLFLLFDYKLTGTIDFKTFSEVLESLGDDNTEELRKQKFDVADKDQNGTISYDEFLNMIYNFHDQMGNQKKLVGLAKLCWDIAENIKFVTSLSVGEQLEYGLF